MPYSRVVACQPLRPADASDPPQTLNPAADAADCLQVASIVGPALAEVPEGKTAVYNDFRMAQIKSLAFLTVMARSQSLQPLMQPHKDSICDAIVRVFQTVPDVLSTRRELLIALRNIMPTPFRCCECPGLLSCAGAGVQEMPPPMLWLAALRLGFGCAARAGHGLHPAAVRDADATAHHPTAPARTLCRPALLHKMDVFLDERVLLGSRSDPFSVLTVAGGVHVLDLAGCMCSRMSAPCCADV